MPLSTTPAEFDLAIVGDAAFRTRHHGNAGCRHALSRADQLGLDEIVSFTALTNRPSEAVMQRIGITDLITLI